MSDFEAQADIALVKMMSVKPTPPTCTQACMYPLPPLLSPASSGRKVTKSCFVLRGLRLPVLLCLLTLPALRGNPSFPPRHPPRVLGQEGECQLFCDHQPRGQRHCTSHLSVPRGEFTASISSSVWKARQGGL